MNNQQLPGRRAAGEENIPRIDLTFFRTATAENFRQLLNAHNSDLPVGERINHRGQNKAGLYNLLITNNIMPLSTKPGHPNNPIIVDDPLLQVPAPVSLPFPADRPRALYTHPHMFPDMFRVPVYLNLTTEQIWALIQTDPTRFLESRLDFGEENNLVRLDGYHRRNDSGRRNFVRSDNAQPSLLEWIISRGPNFHTSNRYNQYLMQIICQKYAESEPALPAEDQAPNPNANTPIERYLSMIRRSVDPPLNRPELQQGVPGSLLPVIDHRPLVHRAASRVRWDPAYCVRTIRFLAAIGFDPNELHGGRRPLDIALAAAATTVPLDRQPVGDADAADGGMFGEAMRAVCALIAVGAQPSLVDAAPGGTAEMAGWMLRSLGWGMVSATDGRTWPIIQPADGVVMTVAQNMGRDTLADRFAMGQGQVLMALVLLFSRTNRWYRFT